MKLPCAVTRDLLPLYAEKMVEHETEILMEEHLADCPECRKKLSEIETGMITPVETTNPLKALKKEIRKRRWFTALIAALCVFIAVSTYFYHADSMVLLPWEDGLIEIRGIEERSYTEIYGHSEVPELRESTLEVLVLRTDSRINGTHEMMTQEEDGTSTCILQGWSSGPVSSSIIREYNEMVFHPVPDRLYYDGGSRQTLLWGTPLHGGTVVLPRLSLTYYVIIAAALAALTGFIWFLLRNRNRSWIVRQVFFAPVSYIIAHLLIKGFRSASFFPEQDSLCILIITAALYTLFSLAWQLWLQRKAEQ